MSVPVYQIHNVMRLFGSRLTGNGAGRPQPVRRMAEAKQRLIASRVTGEIFQRLNRTAIACRQPSDSTREAKPEKNPMEAGPADFTYRLIDADNTERTACLSVRDSSFLLDPFDDPSDKGPQGETD